MRYLSIINLNYFSNQINSKSYYFGKNNKPFSFINVQIRYFNKNINFQNKNQVFFFNKYILIINIF